MMTQDLNLFCLKAGTVVPPGQFEILWAHAMSYSTSLFFSFLPLFVYTVLLYPLLLA